MIIFPLTGMLLWLLIFSAQELLKAEGHLLPAPTIYSNREFTGISIGERERERGRERGREREREGGGGGGLTAIWLVV